MKRKLHMKLPAQLSSYEEFTGAWLKKSKFVFSLGSENKFCAS